ITRNKTEGVVEPERSGLRQSLLRSANNVVLPHPFVGEVMASRGALENLSIAQLRSTQRAHTSVRVLARGVFGCASRQGRKRGYPTDRRPPCGQSRNRPYAEPPTVQSQRRGLAAPVSCGTYGARRDEPCAFALGDAADPIGNLNRRDLAARD